MCKKILCWYMILFFTLPIIALENASKKNEKKASSSGNKSATLLIGIPTDASSNPKEKNEWFSGLSEQYLHFRISASNNLDIIPSEKIHQAATRFKNSSSNAIIPYDSIAIELRATHILQQNYEIDRDDKTVHYYAEIMSTSGSDNFASYEKDFTLQNFTTEMDSCIYWFFKSTGINLNMKMLSRFFNLSTVSSDPKEMKTIGKIICRKYASTRQEISISTDALLKIVERDPLNLLAQYIAAKSYEYSLKYDKATEQLKNLLVIIPNHTSLYNDVCRNCRLSGKYNEALTYAINAEKKGIITPSIMLEGALSLEAMGEYSKAVKAYKAILTKNNIEPNALLFFARQNNRQKNAKAAIKYADRILKINPNNGQAYLEKGKALINLEKYKKAEKILAKSEELLKDDPEPTCLIGEIHSKHKDFTRAAQYYETAYKNKTTDFELLIRTVETWEKAQNLKRALKVLQNAENLFPDSLIIQKKLGIIYCLTGDTANAIFHLEQFLDKGKMEAQVLMMLGDIYTNKGKYEKAFYMYNHAMSLLPDKTKGTFSLALLYLKKGDTGATISYLKEILKKQPDYPDAHRFLADAWFKAENYNKALIDYKKARFLEKNDPYIQKRIAAIYFNLKEYNAATREYIKFLDKNDTDAEAYFCLSISQLHLNKVHKAEEYLAKAFKLGSPNSDVLYMLGNGYAAILNRENSLEYYKKCIEIDPKHENALLILSESYLKNKKIPEAAEIYLKLYDLDNSKFNRFLAKAGLLYEQDNNIEKAYDIYSDFIKNGYNNSKINIHLARIEHACKKYASVITLLEKIPQTEISSKEDMIILADSYCSTGKPAEAIPWLLKIISKDSKNKEALIMLGISYEKIGDINSALKTHKKILRITTGDEQANYAYKIGLLYENAENIKDAINQYNKNIKEYSQDLRNYNQLISIYTKSEDWGATREILEKSVKLPNTKPFYQKKLAEVCLKQNDKAGAVKNYKQYLKINTNDDDAWYQLGDLYFNRGLYSKALILYKKANALRPNNFNILYKSALAFHNTGDISMATDLFNKAYKIDNKNIEVLNYLALCYRSLNEIDKLSKTLMKLAELQPNNYAVRIELGCTLLGHGKTSEAIANLETACKMNPKDAETHIILSGVYATIGNKNARFSHLKKALSENPDNADVYCLMGKFYMEQNQNKTALPHIKKALEIEPEHTQGLYIYSKYLFQQGKINKSLKYIKQAVKNDSYNPPFLALYAMINHALNKKNLALKTIENALLLDSTNAEILSCAGFLYKEAGKTDDAKKILLKAISLSDECFECYSYLGEIYFEETQCAKAAGFFRRALEIKGYDEDIMMKLGRTLVLRYRNEAANEVFEKIFLKNPENHEVFYRLAHIYILWNDLEKVNSLIAQRKNNKKTVWDHLIQGEMNEAQGNVDAALISYKVALRIQPDMAGAHAGNGRIDLINENFNDAIVNFSKALIKDPYNPYLLLDLGKAYEGIGQFSSAFDVYSEVSDKYSQIPDTYCLIAGIRSREKEHYRAIEIVKQGLKHNPENAELYSILGREYGMIKEFENSINAYKNAAKKGGKNHIDAYLKIANIYHNNLKNEKEAKKFIKKYLKKGGSKKEIAEYNMANLNY